MATVAQEAAEDAAGTVRDLQDQLTATEGQVREAAARERMAADAVTQGTAARDRRDRQWQQLQSEVRSIRQERADQQRLRDDAWAAMPGLSGTLSADRCREGVGGARFPLGSLS
ncbi:hypothetical protein [Streptomyces sp. SYP-A7185]|uniref:hypothetical protein n=1 Tax=Streptomyces sp. SYP-A7185 TaxID=3040076 RepID=UPI0038F6C741